MDGLMPDPSGPSGDTRAATTGPFSLAGFTGRLDRLMPLATPILASETRPLPGTTAPRVRIRDAAVLVPVIADPETPRLILTRRTDHLSSHAGQVAFPGGKIDAGDRDAVHAALREAHEEIGLPCDLVRPVGYGDPMLTHTGFRIVPVVALVTPGAPVAANPGEVAEVFDLPLSVFMTPANYRRTDWERDGLRGFYYDIEHDSIRRLNHRIWGITAVILHRLAERIYGPR